MTKKDKATLERLKKIVGKAKQPEHKSREPKFAMLDSLKDEDLNLSPSHKDKDAFSRYTKS